jgi:hypothetical protein
MIGWWIVHMLTRPSYTKAGSGRETDTQINLVTKRWVEGRFLFSCWSTQLHAPIEDGRPKGRGNGLLSRPTCHQSCTARNTERGFVCYSYVIVYCLPVVIIGSSLPFVTGQCYPRYCILSSTSMNHRPITFTYIRIMYAWHKTGTCFQC